MIAGHGQLLDSISAVFTDSCFFAFGSKILADLLLSLLYN